ncbi:MAG: glycosyltransferase family 4 protein [Deltaproteobacteria bacterium]|nr:glycosyltransferase family 4 protein [Deltaproteobacteria bacterium]
MSFTILHTESSKGWGGQENRTLKESIGLKKMGERIIIACPSDSKLAKAGADNGIEIRTVSMESSISPSAIFSLLKIIKQENVNIVCTHSGKDSMLGAIAGRLSKMKPKIVRTRHLALPITSKITYSILPHKVVTVSEYVRKYLVEEKGISADKVVSIPTGVDLERFNPDIVKPVSREDLKIPSDAIIVGTIAMLRRKKGHHTLLDAIPLVLKEFPKTIFLFVGNGPQKENIEKKIIELGIGGNVKLVGLRKDVPEILKTIDLFVLPTLQEALGTSFLEAMAMRKPVIGTKVGGVPEVVNDGVSGMLVEPENPDALAHAIINIFKDRDRMNKIGDEGRMQVENKYSVDVMVKKLYDFYKSIITENKK